MMEILVGMVHSNSSGFQSIRILALLVHILCIPPLYWTRIDSITVSTSNLQQQQDESDTYLAVISFSLACLVIQALYLGSNLTNITFTYCLHLLLDVIGIFFALWIALDNLSWKTFIVISTFCMSVIAFHSLTPSLSYLIFLSSFPFQSDPHID
jgi:hypothetical protein